MEEGVEVEDLQITHHHHHYLTTHHLTMMQTLMMNITHLLVTTLAMIYLILAAMQAHFTETAVKACGIKGEINSMVKYTRNMQCECDAD